jgi:hypothetical protein
MSLLKTPGFADPVVKIIGKLEVSLKKHSRSKSARQTLTRRPIRRHAIMSIGTKRTCSRACWMSV